MRPEVKRLVELGPLPSESEATQEELQKIEAEYRSIQRPVSDAEARALISLFGPDGCYGLASSILHLIETAPGWPLKDCLVHSENEFIVSLFPCGSVQKEVASFEDATAIGWGDASQETPSK